MENKCYESDMPIQWLTYGIWNCYASGQLVYWFRHLQYFIGYIAGIHSPSGLSAWHNDDINFCHSYYKSLI